MSASNGELKPLSPDLARTARMALHGGSERALVDTSERVSRALEVHDQRGLLSDQELDRLVQIRVVLDLLDPEKGWESLERTGVAIELIVGLLHDKIDQIQTDGGATEENNLRKLREDLQRLMSTARSSSDLF